MLNIVSGGNNGKKTTPDKDLLKTWIIVTDNDKTFKAQGTDIHVGDLEEGVTVYNKGLVIFSSRDALSVQIDDPLMVQDITKPKVRRKRKTT